MITLYQLDVMEALKKLPDESVDMQITSPPYWGLRDYGIEGQLGLEPNFEDYIKRLCDIFDEVKRVLKKDGTCWVNLGDTYCCSPTGSMKGLDTTGWDRPSRRASYEAQIKQICPVCKKEFKGGVTKIFCSTECLNTLSNEERTKYKPVPAKCLLAIPERFMIEMINRGWILRNKIIWHKPNHMPTSVKDRFANSWEYLFLFSKSKKYYFDLDAVREPHKSGRPAYFNLRVRDVKKGKDKSHQYKASEEEVLMYDKKYGDDELDTRNINPKGRNPDDCWDITIRGYPEAHFAVFPEALVKKPIKTTKKKAVIMDIFCGSGTTLKVARDLHRDSIGIEIKPEYCKLIYKRLFNGNVSLFPNEFKLISS